MFLAGAFGRGVVWRAFDNDPVSFFFAWCFLCPRRFLWGGFRVLSFVGPGRLGSVCCFLRGLSLTSPGFKWVSCFCVLAVRFLVCAGLRRPGSAVAGLFFVVSSGCVLVVCFLVGVGLRRPRFCGLCVSGFALLFVFLCCFIGPCPFLCGLPWVSEDPVLWLVGFVSRLPVVVSLGVRSKIEN